MKILYITTTLPFSAGAEIFFVPEIQELLRGGHQLQILPRSCGGKIEKEAQFLVSMVDGLPHLSLRIIVQAVGAFLRTPFPALRALATILGRGDTLCRLKNLVVYPTGLYAGRLARRWGADHIHAYWASTMATIAFVAHETSGVPWSFTAHRGDIVQGNLLAEKIAKASFVRVISRSGVKLLSDAAPSASTTKFRVIHMGVAIPSGMSPLVPSQADLRFKILTPANLLPVKGHQHLIEALAILKARGFNCRLDLAGRGPFLKNLMNLAASLDVSEEVVFLGQLPHHEIISRYMDRKVDVVVLPSVDLGCGNHEGIPVSLMEAMAHGVPVVSTATGGIPELVTPGTGILVPPGDASALAMAIGSLIDNEGLRRRLAEKGRNRILESFNIVDVVRQLVVEMSASLVPVELAGDMEQNQEIR